MVRAILDGTKTQTRRIVKPLPSGHALTVTMHPIGHAEFYRNHRCLDIVRCPYSKPGDNLWVRETWSDKGDMRPFYRADNGSWLPYGGKWKPSIFMPRWASRITLEVESVRVERLQAISEADAIAEGIKPFPSSPSKIPVMQYQDLWESINGPGSWQANPWVWVITFKRVKP